MERVSKNVGLGMTVLIMLSCVLLAVLMVPSVEGRKDLKNAAGEETKHPETFNFGTPGSFPSFPAPGAGFGGFGTGPGNGIIGSGGSSRGAGGSGSSIFCSFPGVNCDGGAAGGIGAKTTPKP